MQIPLVHLSGQYKSIQKQVDKAILSVCAKSDYILGEKVATFEKEFASYIGTKYAIGVASGTDAIKLMAVVAGIGKGDEVIVQANTFISTILPFIELGAKPVFVDCLPESGQMDTGQIEKAITKRTRAIIPVHLYGHPAPIVELSKLIAESRLPIVILEDAAQAHGSTIDGKHCGSFGNMAAFSFYPGKNLGAYGDGGAVVTNSMSHAVTLKMLRNIGQKQKYDHRVLGFNSRLDTIQAAVLSVKLRHLDSWNKKRNIIATMYMKKLSGVGDIILPQPFGYTQGKPSTRNPKTATQTNWHLFIIRTKKRDALMRHLDKHGIQCGIHYPVPLHLTPALKFLGYKKGDFPGSEMRAKTILSIPMYAELKQNQQRYIIQVIQNFFL